MAGRPKFTTDQLRDGGNHVLYSVLMLCNTVALLSDEKRWSHGWKDKTEYMAVLESFLVNVRTLMYFLCPPKGYKQSKLKERELFAVDFCPPGWTARRWKGFNEERDRISANLAHLSIDRPPLGEMWEYTRLRDQLAEMLLKFVDDADDRLSAYLKAAIRGVLGGDHVALPDGVSPV
jgi:hypothetical protein